MLNVSILRGPTAVSAIQGSLEMDTATVQVSSLQAKTDIVVAAIMSTLVFVSTHK